ncbi:hypothetical protein GQ600_5322 [Phytophthora cactorum]|nr:hypothetical protein GQ600_5322 [Phytophthora cactorum]
MVGNCSIVLSLARGNVVEETMITFGGGVGRSAAQQQYNRHKDAMLEILRDNKDNHLYKSCMQQCDSSTDA